MISLICIIFKSSFTVGDSRMILPEVGACWEEEVERKFGQLIQCYRGEHPNVSLHSWMTVVNNHTLYISK